MNTINELIRISPLVIAVVSCIGLVNILVIVRISQNRFARESKILAAKLSEEFAKELLPDISTNLLSGNKTRYQIQRWEMKDYKFNSDSLVNKNDAQAWHEARINDGSASIIIDFINRLEAFSMYFVMGAADQKVVRSCLAPIYCEWIEIFAPILIELRNRKDINVSGPFQNIVILYESWHCRENEDKLNKDIRVMKERKGYYANRGKLQKPIGT